MAQFFRSQRGRPKLGHGGYIYQCQRETEHEMRWRCEAREKKEKCPAKAKSMGNIVTILKPHNHPPDYANVEKEILKRNIIDNAAAQGLSTTMDLTGIISSLPNSLASKMPTLDCMKRAIRRRQNITVQSNRSTMEGPLPTSTGTDYYSSISDNAIGGGSMDIFINNHQQHHSQNQLFDAKALQSSLFDDEDSNNPTTSNFPIIFEQPLNLNEEIPSNEGAAAATINSGTSNNDAMEFFSLLQSQINDLRAENDLLRGHLKTTDERLVEIEKRLKINRKEIPADAKFEIARLTLSKIGTFQFFGGPKTVDVASFLRQIAPEEQTSDPKLPRQLFTDCINMILGDSVIYYSYKKNPKEGCCQLDPNLFNCILGLICDGYGLSKDPQKDSEKDKYLRECIAEELNITARKVFKNAADPHKSKPLSSNNFKNAIIEPPSSTPQSRPHSNATVSVKAETEPEPPVYCIDSDEESD